MKWLCITPHTSSGSISISEETRPPGPRNNSCATPSSTLRQVNAISNTWARKTICRLLHTPSHAVCKTCFKGNTAESLAVETAWRRTQSYANPSPREFPANREKYRDFHAFGPPDPICYRGKCLILDSFRSQRALLLRSNRELSEAYQGIQSTLIRELSPSSEHSLHRHRRKGRLLMNTAPVQDPAYE